jgi:hypothetical protein
MISVKILCYLLVKLLNQSDLSLVHWQCKSLWCLQRHGKCREISRLVGLRGNPEHSRQPAILTGLDGLIYRLLIDDLSTVQVTGIT